MLAYVRLGLKAFQEDILSIPVRALLFLAAVLLVLFPLMNRDPYLLSLLTYTAIFAIFAASWDMLAGFTGVVSLAHGVLFGISAYTAALLNLRLGMPPYVTIPIGAIVAVLTGLIVAIPSLRVKGMYFTLCSIAMPFIFRGIVFSFPDFTGGELGMSGIDSLGGSKLITFYIVLAVMILSGLIMWKLTDSRSEMVRLGIFLQAVRADEIAARASGVNTVKQKLIAFAVSGFFAGVAGGLYAHAIHVAGPSTLELMFAFNPLIWTIFGGIATIGGPIVGTFILYPVIEFLRVIPELRTLIFACLIIAILYFMPEGITHWFRDKAEEICPRCKLVNITFRRRCRACDALLHLERKNK